MTIGFANTLYIDRGDVMNGLLCFFKDEMMILMKNEHVPEERKLQLKICYDFILNVGISILANYG